MKRFIILGSALVLGVSAALASQTESNSEAAAPIEMASSRVNVPTGIYFNGSNFIKVESTWLRVCIGGNSQEYNFHAEIDPWGNYALSFGNGQSITIYSNGRSLNYNGTTYSKK